MDILRDVKMELGEPISEELFLVYAEKVRTLIEVLGLSGWDVEFMHTSELGKIDLCITVVDIPNRDVTFMLNKNWREPISERKIKMAAAHEVLHLLLGRLNHLALARFVRKEEIEEEMHSIIRRFENILFLDLNTDDEVKEIYSSVDGKMNEEEEGFEMEFDMPGLNEEEEEKA